MISTEILVDVKTLSTRLHEPNLRVIDCRFDLAAPEDGERAYLAAHIPGAVYAHLDRDLSGEPVTDHGRHPLPAPSSIGKTFANMGVSAHSEVVVYDAQGGMIAARAWWMLRYIGLSSVAVLDGGWQAWLAAGAATEHGAREYPLGLLEPETAAERLVVYDELVPNMQLVDARESRRYLGEFEPIDPRAGHIPGAENHFFGNNLDENRCFRSPQEIKAAFQQSIGGLPDEQTVHYCGSGVSACHNILAQVYAGLPEPRLYGGSWSEWSKFAADSEDADV